VSDDRIIRDDEGEILEVTIDTPVSVLVTERTWYRGVLATTVMREDATVLRKLIVDGGASEDIQETFVEKAQLDGDDITYDEVEWV